MASTDEGNETPPQHCIKFVNKGLRAPAYHPEDPQTYLWKTNHPYAPFVGNALTWESYVFDDATTYEGLCREEVPHGMGILVMGFGTGGGIQRPQHGDKYEGEFYAGFAHGLGMYTSPNGEVYRGEWSGGKKQGCGMLMNYSSYHDMIRKGNTIEEAWDKTKDKILANAQFGTWKKDYFVAGPDESGSGRFCHINEIKGTLQELEAVLTKARMFRWKPDGDVTLRFAQDADGKPLPLMQDPLHYPFGTKFMAPGPLGQCHRVPDDDNIKSVLSLHARNFQRIHDMYNIDYDPAPGSDLWKAMRHWKKMQEKKKLQMQRMQEKQQRRRRMQERRSRGSKKEKSEDRGSKKEKSEDRRSKREKSEDRGSKKEKSEDQGNRKDKSEDTKGKEGDSSGKGGRRAVSSVSMSLVRCATAVTQAIEAAAIRARPIPRLARPSSRWPFE